MERKIGEIFELGGEWYQCIIGHCNQCSFDEAGTCKFIGNPYCAYRNDKKLACFKKLEKVGEPYERFLLSNKSIKVQRYKLPYRYAILPKEPIMILEPNYKNSIEIEIKQTKEDMEEKKQNLKPFDLEAAKAGKPVCTRDGRKARIICFDRITCDDYSKIVACVTTYDGKDEYVLTYGINGYIVNSQHPKDEDLMMLPEKKEGWANVMRGNGNKPYVGNDIYETKEKAEQGALRFTSELIDTVRICWEE